MRTGTDALISIRRLRGEDREPLERILKATDMFTAAEVNVALELIDTFLTDPHQGDYFISTGVEDDGRVVGYYCIGPAPLTDGTFDLYWIAVDPAAQGAGFGKQLLHQAEEETRMMGGRLLIAETSSQAKYVNTRAFYERTGYEVIARIRDYYKRGDDLVIYGKYVSQ